MSMTPQTDEPTPARAQRLTAIRERLKSFDGREVMAHAGDDIPWLLDQLSQREAQIIAAVEKLAEIHRLSTHDDGWHRRWNVVTSDRIHTLAREALAALKEPTER